MIYYLNDVTLKENNAGFKARKDINDIFELKSYKKVNFYKHSSSKIIKFLQLILFFIKYLFIFKKNDVLIVQMPYIRMSYRFISMICKIKNIKLVVFIHDLEYLRSKNKHFKCEIDFLKKCLVICSHNKKMSQYLVSHGISSKRIVELNIFDYLMKNNKIKHKVECDVCFAGNLTKSQFIYKFEPHNLKVSYFGNKIDKQLPRNTYYKGSYRPEELLSNLDGKYGLIWDGDSIESCTGLFGDYMRYNNPHKLSMYLAAQIPVVCWSESAIASFVLENEVGIVVDSLLRLDEILPKVTNAEYNKMLINVVNISNQLKNGYYTLSVLDEIENKLEEN